MQIVRQDPFAITRMFGTGLEDMDITLTHTKRGTSYNIVCIAVREDDQVPVMVYRDVDSGNRWVRPLADFICDKNEDGTPKWTWNRKADKIMEMIRSALKSYNLGQWDKTSK